MGRLRFLLDWVALLLVLAVCGAGPAQATIREEPSFAPACHAASAASVTIADMVPRTAWNCSAQGWVAARPTAWLRFEATSWQGEERPRYFFSRIARHERITFAALDADGTLRVRSFVEADGRPFGAGPVFQLPLPEVRDETRALIVRIDRPHSIPLLTEARLAHFAGDADWSQIDMMLLALVIGMLVLPLLFDISFFLVLRERFVVTHAAMVTTMMIYVLTAGGLISVVVSLPLVVIAIAAPLSYAVGAGLSALFLADFLERGAQSRLMRRLTVGAGVWTIAVPGIFALQLHSTQSFDDRGYFIAFLPLIVIITAAVIEAIIRGSRSARFIGMAWAPIMFASIERLLRGLGVYAGPSLLDQMLYIAIGLEVVMISLAIADRFLALRHERDAALTEARMLEQLSTRDSLTGLMNRRAIEARFEHLLDQGFDTFALVDLDSFKAINDLHGHQVGDAALVACAAAMRSSGDRDAVAVRLGGEEFVVLLRGERTLERAEALRQSIPLRIATDVPGLDLPVTASMGLVILPGAGQHRMSFPEFYARADTLMYEAKAAGRNRMAYERLNVFNTAPRGRSERVA